MVVFFLVVELNLFIDLTVFQFLAAIFVAI